jgi:hypothetical protein
LECFYSNILSLFALHFSAEDFDPPHFLPSFSGAPIQIELASAAPFCSSNFLWLAWNVPEDVFICAINPRKSTANIARFNSWCDGPIVT